MKRAASVFEYSGLQVAWGRANLGGLVTLVTGSVNAAPARTKRAGTAVPSGTVSLPFASARKDGVQWTRCPRLPPTGPMFRCGTPNVLAPDRFRSHVASPLALSENPRNLRFTHKPGRALLFL